jgi:hypothetical protein
MAQLGLAVVLRQVLGQIDESLFRGGVAGVAVRFVEGVDRVGPVHDHRLLPILAVEHDPAAEPADRRHARLGEDFVAPDVHHRRGELGLVVRGKKQPLAEVQAAAAAQRD